MAGHPQDFVLLDRGADSWLFRHAVEQIVAHSLDEVVPALGRLDHALASGLHCAGYLSFEAGLALESRLAGHAGQVRLPYPVMWFGLYAARESVSVEEALKMLGAGGAGGASTCAPVPTIARQAYAAAFAHAKQAIHAGDIYQINLTFPNMVAVNGSPLDIYAAVRDRAAARHGAVVHANGHDFLSFSPELFFEYGEGRIMCRPMKGTASRASGKAADDDVVANLAADPKQRAENLMIVDLLRNDLSRIAEPGSVQVPRLYEVETYPTLHQMTSTVTANLKPGTPPSHILRALFPCGSITGAPKIRAIELIRALEARPRGIYTGSIGAFCPDGQARFNVAIRTLALAEGATQGELGLGSGVVADSQMQNEWDECLKKGAFLGPADAG